LGGPTKEGEHEIRNDSSHGCGNPHDGNGHCGGHKSDLTTAMVIVAAINPSSFSMEATGLVVIAAYLSGIYSELKRSNDLRAKE